MSGDQVIEKDGKPLYYVVPTRLWQQVRSDIEDAEDAAAYAQSKASTEAFTIPLAVVEAELGGMHSVRAWREHRGMTMQSLADAVGLSKPYVSQIESRKRAGTAATLKKLARALDVPLDVLQA